MSNKNLIRIAVAAALLLCALTVLAVMISSKGSNADTPPSTDDSTGQSSSVNATSQTSDAPDEDSTGASTGDDLDIGVEVGPTDDTSTTAPTQTPTTTPEQIPATAPTQAPTTSPTEASATAPTEETTGTEDENGNFSFDFDDL